MQNRIETNVCADVLALLNGSWRSAYTYRPNDIASYGSKMYICLQNALNKRPDTNTDYWTLLYTGAAVLADQDFGPASDETFPRVLVRCANAGDAFHDGYQNSGVYQVDMELLCQSYSIDDQNRTLVRRLGQAVRDILLWDDLPAQLNTASTYNTYFGAVFGDSFEEPPRDGLHLLTIPLRLLMSPATVS